MISVTMTTEINDEYALMEEGTGPEIVKYGSIDDRVSIIPPIKPLSTKAFSRNKYEEDFKKNRDENKNLPFYMRDVTISEFYNYPNPVTDHTTFRYFLNSASSARLKIYTSSSF